MAQPGDHWNQFLYTCKQCHVLVIDLPASNHSILHDGIDHTACVHKRRDLVERIAQSTTIFRNITNSYWNRYVLFSGSLICFTIFGVMGRNTARARSVDTLSLTAFPLAIGGGLSLLIAIPIEGFPHASIQTWGLIAWLAVVNTSLAYMLYNHSLQILTAFQTNVLLNLAPIGTAVMGWFLLGEQLNLLQFIGIVVVIVGASLVQVRNSSEKLKEEIVVP